MCGNKLHRFIFAMLLWNLSLFA